MTLPVPGKRIGVAKIGSVDVPVYVVTEPNMEQLLGGQVAWGAFSPNKCVIALRKDLSPSLAMTVFIHELTHAGFDLLPRAKLTEERACDVAGCVVAQNYALIEKVAGRFK